MTNQGCERFEEICTLVAAGAAMPEEEQALNAHLAKGCPACTAAKYELQEAAVRLAEIRPPVPPPPAVRARLLDAVHQEMEVAPSKRTVRPSAGYPIARRFPWLWASGWAVAAVLGWILVLNINADRRVFTKQAAEVERLHLTLAEKEGPLRLIQARQTQIARLAGLTPAPNAFGKVFWNPEANAGFLIVFDLIPLPPGKVYQLWAIQGDVPVDAGIFSLDTNGVGAVKVKPLPDPRRTVKLFAITIEPIGGSPKPTGEMFLKGATASF